MWIKVTAIAKTKSSQLLLFVIFEDLQKLNENESQLQYSPEIRNRQHNDILYALRLPLIFYKKSKNKVMGYENSDNNCSILNVSNS
jgi:hypothetical protein